MTHATAPRRPPAPPPGPAYRRRAPVAALLLVLLAARAAAAAPHFPVPGRPDAGPRPRSVLLPEDRDRVVARLTREPYRTLLARIADIAAEIHDPADDTVYTVTRRANTARAAALLFYLGWTVDATGTAVPLSDPAARRALGEKAAAHLLAMNTRSYAKGLDSTLDILTAQELHLWADTLDLLLGAEEDVLGADRARAVQQVADLAADFYYDYTVGTAWMLRSETANHRSKSAAALGIAALVLNGEPFSPEIPDGRYDPAAWLDFAMRYCDLVVRDLMTDADGGFAEGLPYMAYSAIDHVPFYWAWHQLAGGAGAAVDWSQPVGAGYRFHASGVYVVPDFWTDPLLARQVRWAALLLLPDGTLPPFDDAPPGQRFFFGAFVRPEFADAPLFRWAWEQTRWFTGGSVDTATLQLVTFDDTIPPASPEALGIPQHRVFPYAGQVLFRSGTGPDAVAALLMAEHGTAAARVQTRWGDDVDGAAGHEHPDGAAFALWAYGEALALDPGYITWDEHQRVNRPEHHNVLLVDGQGAEIHRMVVPEVTFTDDGQIVFLHPEQEGGWSPARDGMAYLVRWDTETPGAAYAEVRTEYHEEAPATDITRGAAFLRNRFLVLLDTARVADGDPGHELTLQIHGHGGGTGGGTATLTATGARWTRAAAQLRAAVSTAPGPPVLALREAEHDVGGRQARTHLALDATVRGAGLRAVTVLAPERVPADGDAIVRLEADGCAGPCVTWSTADATCFAWQDFPHSVTGGPGSPWLEANWGAYCQDASALAGIFGGVEATPGEPDPDSLIVLRLDLDASAPSGPQVVSWEARLLGHGPDAPRVTLLLPDAASPIRVEGACSATRVGDRWQIAAPLGARVRTVPAATPAGLPPVALVPRDLPPDAPRVAPLGSPVTLHTLESCLDPDRVRPTFSWITRPELSDAGLWATDGGTAVTFTSDLPGRYGVAAEFPVDGGVARATAWIEAEGALGWEADAGALPDALPSADASAPAPASRGGCGCQPAGGGDPAAGLLLLLGFWGLRSRRRLRERRLRPGRPRAFPPAR